MITLVQVQARSLYSVTPHRKLSSGPSRFRIILHVSFPYCSSHIRLNVSLLCKLLATVCLKNDYLSCVCHPQLESLFFPDCLSSIIRRLSRLRSEEQQSVVQS